jgi:coenzyme F420-reducing hydrogenase alpha subunit
MIEGQININVIRQHFKVEEVRIASSRHLHAAKLLVGKTPEQALAIVPLLFNICGIAHSYNARKVLGLDNRANDNLNKLLVLAETLKEHLLRIFLDTPKLLSIKNNNTNLPFIIQITSNLKKHILKEGNNQRPINQFIDQIDEYIQKHVFELHIKQWLNISDTKALFNWSQQSNTIAAVTINIIGINNWQHQGHCKINGLPELKPLEILKKLKDSNNEDFIAFPRWNNQPHETTPLTRQLENPLIQNVLEKYQGGLLVRWLARLVEIAKIPEKMRNLLNENSKNIVHNFNSIAQVEAARGRLIHKADIKDNIVQSYQIVAPTEWNFHPDGLIADSLQNINTQSTEEYTKIAHLLINSIDPCVGYQLSVH